MDQEAVRARLHEERKRLDTTAEQLASDLDLDEPDRSSLGELTDVDQNPADMATETSEREKDTALLTTLRERRVEVDAALQRVEAGEYGLCEACGDPIGDERLEAFPMARFCIEHQAQQEERRGA